jgi:hypothetical protein
LENETLTQEEGRTHNSTYKKLAAQWLNEALCFVSSLVLADSFVLRNRQLLVAAKRYVSPLGDIYTIIISMTFTIQSVGS